MPDLKAPAFRRRETLADGRTAYQELWEVPSDPRARGDVRAWACLQVSYSPGLGQWVPSLRRIYTRSSGAVREVAGTSMQPMRWNFTGAETDLDAARQCAQHARAFLPDLLVPEPPIVPNPIATKIFPPVDVLA